MLSGPGLLGDFFILSDRTDKHAMIYFYLFVTVFHNSSLVAVKALGLIHLVYWIQAHYWQWVGVLSNLFFTLKMSKEVRQECLFIQYLNRKANQITIILVKRSSSITLYCVRWVTLSSWACTGNQQIGSLDKSCLGIERISSVILIKHLTGKDLQNSFMIFK